MRGDAGLVLRGLIEAAGLPFRQALGRPNYHADPFWKPQMVDRLVEGAGPLETALAEIFLAGRPLDPAVARDALGGDAISLFTGVGLLEELDQGLLSPRLLVSYLNRHVLAAPPPSHTRFKADAVPYCGPESLWFAKVLALRGPYRRALDLCTGTGLQAMLPQAGSVLAVDIDEKALEAAGLNLALNLVEHVELRSGDLFAGLDEAAFDLITANPPFVPDAPNNALPVCGAGGRRGDEVLRRILLAVADHLAPGGEALIYAEGFGDAVGPAILHDIEREALSRRHDYACLIGGTQSGEQASLNLVRLWQRLGCSEDAAWTRWRDLAGLIPTTHYHHCLWRVHHGQGRIEARRMFFR